MRAGSAESSSDDILEVLFLLGGERERERVVVCSQRSIALYRPSQEISKPTEIFFEMQKTGPLSQTAHLLYPCRVDGFI